MNEIICSALRIFFKIFFVSSKNFQAAIAASHDDAKRICQISSTRHVSHEPGYEIVPLFTLCRLFSFATDAHSLGSSHHPPVHPALVERRHPLHRAGHEGARRAAAAVCAGAPAHTLERRWAEAASSTSSGRRLLRWSSSSQSASKRHVDVI